MISRGKGSLLSRNNQRKCRFVELLQPGHNFLEPGQHICKLDELNYLLVDFLQRGILHELLTVVLKERDFGVSYSHHYTYILHLEESL
jgi:hypothetical protein